ncbi:hypothetical protein [Phaeocystidibacter luteus]|uniref:Uncharacterized protein n=1 Tax=Phaeocystidibacter luteus TaxID=911197 RepID=A0A6N6RLX3_9FLAO|nr:hypothetical protein [Phaeocystidibacter luteus]KAB2814581.1 hypothetical protein F8C67_02240 [Phaeocystidibacter luteus]
MKSKYENSALGSWIKANGDELKPFKAPMDYLVAASGIFKKKYSDAIDVLIDSGIYAGVERNPAATSIIDSMLLVFRDERERKIDINFTIVFISKRIFDCNAENLLECNVHGHGGAKLEDSADLLRAVWKSLQDLES